MSEKIVSRPVDFKLNKEQADFVKARSRALRITATDFIRKVIELSENDALGNLSGAGARPFTTRRSYRLSEKEIEALTNIGEGERMVGIRRLVQAAMKSPNRL